MRDVEWRDIQGLILSPYKERKHAAYIFLAIRAPDAAKNWIGDLIADGWVTDAQSIMKTESTARTSSAADDAPTGQDDVSLVKRADYWVNMAFTAGGLMRLGLETEDMERFPPEFQEGMDQTLRRATMLGDVASNSAGNWDWGTEALRPDLLLMVFSDSPNLLEKKRIWSELAIPKGVELAASKAPGNDDTGSPFVPCRLERTEHFGFADGLSQPVIFGSPAAQRRKGSARELEIVNPGEFILGYVNERNRFPPSPTVSQEFDRNAILPSVGGRADFGRNGTFLVVRQLEQNVAQFENFLQKMAKNSRERDVDWLAARFVGRWRSGAPLVRYPDRDPNDYPETEDRFLYHYEDRYGLKCPIGAHIRRANPRDSLGPDPETALRLSNRRRIIRRGRMYGDRLDTTRRTRSGRIRDDNKKRGLLFICLNASIADQFELLQHSWLNNRHFAGLYDERDPLLNLGGSTIDNMSIQETPTNLRIDGLQNFVQMRGGGYFFMPGIAALRCLAA